jgi:flagellar motor switch protein FliM
VSLQNDHLYGGHSPPAPVGSHSDHQARTLHHLHTLASELGRRINKKKLRNQAEVKTKDARNMTKAELKAELAKMRIYL